MNGTELHRQRSSGFLAAVLEKAKRDGLELSLAVDLLRRRQLDRSDVKDYLADREQRRWRRGRG